MTSCDYCDHDERACAFCEHDAHPLCDGCGAACCQKHINADGPRYLCAPDPATWPGRGCYNPPVAEVADE